MTDPDLLAQKLAFIETCVRELRILASHIVSDERLGEPQTICELFDRLAQHGWLPADLGTTMGRMASFRSIVVHGYGGVNLEIVRDIVEHRLDDLLRFATTIRARLPGSR